MLAPGGRTFLKGFAMLTRRQSLSAAIGGLGLAAALATAAFAAAPAPHARKYYDNSKQHAKSSIFLLISANGKKIVPGPDFFHGGPQGSNVDPACSAGQAQAGFNGTSLKLSHGHYGFSDTWTAHAQIIESKPGGGEKLVPVTLKITITGKVKNAKTISGTIKWKGCNGAKTSKFNYKATYDPTFSE
jgi:hypothetical protein